MKNTTIGKLLIFIIIFSTVSFMFLPKLIETYPNITRTVSIIMWVIICIVPVGVFIYYRFIKK